MRKRYKKYPIPYEAWENFKKKQEKINYDYLELTGKKRIVPLSKIILHASKKPLFLDQSEIFEISKRRKK